MSVDVCKLEGQDAKGIQSRVSQEMGFLETYRYVMDKAGGQFGFAVRYAIVYSSIDPRVADWPLMASPFPVLGIIVSYLAFVLRVGPNYMRNRKPYNLNNLMICYNVFVAVASGAVFYGLLTSGFTTTLTLGCEPVRVSYDAESYTMAKWMWWLLLLKLCELADTVIFVLRKKYNQASFLHVYHHTSTAILSWIACKFVPGGMWAFTVMPNCLVHVIMYTYYLLACLSPEMQKRVAPWKRYITTLQLIQFVIMILHTFQSLLPGCEPEKKPISVFYLSQMVIMFYMFCDYFRKSYISKKTQ